MAEDPRRDEVESLRRAAAKCTNKTMRAAYLRKAARIAGAIFAGENRAARS